jgi:hypothetical protein
MAAVKFNRSGRGRNKQVLRYPLKMFTAGTDYLQIDMLDYAPVGRKENNKEGKVVTRYVTKPNEGFRRNTNKQALGTILLPIPGDIQDKNSVNYSDDSMNSIVGAGLGGTENLMIDVGAMGSLLVSGKFDDMSDAGKTAISNLTAALSDSGLSFNEAKNLITKSLTGQALSVFGGNVTLQGLLARSQGQVFNPNMELLFNGPSLRNFNFTFKMIPRSADEGEEIKQIIRFFKRGMAPKAENSGLYLKTPNVFELRYRQGNGEHQFLHRFKQCFLTDVSVSYTGESVYATYDNGTPVSMVMNLSFKELAPIYDIDYDSEGNSGPLADPDLAFKDKNTGFGGVGY